MTPCVSSDSSFHLYPAWGMVMSQLIRKVPGTFNLRKKLVTLTLTFLLSIVTIIPFQACQPAADQKDISAMSQNDVEPKLPPDVELIRDPSNGTVRVLKGDGLTAPLLVNEEYQHAVSNRLPGEIAIAFINAYRGLFKIQDPGSELTVNAIETDHLGLTHVRLKQQYNGLEVYPADINVHFNQSGEVYLVQGRYAKTPSNVVIEPRLGEADVLGAVSKEIGIKKTQLRKYSTALIVYCGANTAPQLAYRMYAEVSLSKAWNYVVDSQTGAILNKTSAIQDQSILGKPTKRKIIQK
jgi:hypothetical protein